MEDERPAGYVGGFRTRGLDVAEDALLLSLAGIRYCLRVAPAAVANTFRSYSLSITVSERPDGGQ